MEVYFVKKRFAGNFFQTYVDKKVLYQTRVRINRLFVFVNNTCGEFIEERRDFRCFGTLCKETVDKKTWELLQIEIKRIELLKN